MSPSRAQRACDGPLADEDCRVCKRSLLERAGDLPGDGVCGRRRIGCIA